MRISGWSGRHQRLCAPFRKNSNKIYRILHDIDTRSLPGSPQKRKRYQRSRLSFHWRQRILIRAYGITNYKSCWKSNWNCKGLDVTTFRYTFPTLMSRTFQVNSVQPREMKKSWNVRVVKDKKTKRRFDDDNRNSQYIVLIVLFFFYRETWQVCARFKRDITDRYFFL